jgi:hypothetical protein
MKKMILKTVLVGAAISVSFILAAAGFGILHDRFGITTPGMLVSDALVPPSPSYHQEFASVGQAIRVQIIVDWLFWFALICALYWLLGRLGRKARQPS